MGVAVAAGGAIGASGRYLVSLLLPSHAGELPWGTLAVNLSGSAALGVLVVLVDLRLPRRRLLRPLLGAGLIGAFTTFSTFVVEAAMLARHDHVVEAIAYLAASLVGGILAVWLGMTGARVALRASVREPRELA